MITETSLLGHEATPLRDERPPLVVLIVIHFGDQEVTRRCLRSIERLTYAAHATVVVHVGGLVDPLINDFPQAHHELLTNNLGYAAAVNAGIVAARTLQPHYMYVLNNDVEVDTGALEPLVSACESDGKIGVAGAIHYDLRHREVIQNSGSFINWITGRVWTVGAGIVDRSEYSGLRDPDFICGAGLFIPTRVADKVGAFDERYFLYCEESDWCFRVRAQGFRIARVPQSKLFHAGGTAVKNTPGQYQYYATRNKMWLIKRWAPRRSFVAFVALHGILLYPKMLIGRLARLDIVGFKSTFKGIVDGFRPPIS